MVKCEPSENGRHCETHYYLPLYPVGQCLEGLAQKAIREPKCHCDVSTIWAERRQDGNWDIGDDDTNLEQRTCLACGASLSRTVPKG